MRVFKDDILLLQREWMFLFNYLLIYPDVIKECVADFHKASHFTKLKLQTHKVRCSFVIITSAKGGYVFGHLSLFLCQQDYLQSNEQLGMKLYQRCVSGQGTPQQTLDVQPM